MPINDSNSMRPRRPFAHRAMTLVELLVVVLIMAIIMSIAVPLYLNAVADSQRKTCRTNQHTIANAVEAAKVHLLYNDFASFIGAPVNTTNEPDLQYTPLCPQGGTYSIEQGSSNDATSFKIVCSVSAHGSFEPGVDFK